MNRVRVIASIRVGGRRTPQVADRDWEEVGRKHFLTREAFNVVRHRMPRPTVIRVGGGSMMEHAWIDRLVYVAFFVLLPLYGVRWLCHWSWPAGARWLETSFLAWLRRSPKALLQLAWDWPRKELGVFVTVWLWMVGTAVMFSIFCLLTGETVLIFLAIVTWALIYVCWRLLKYFHERHYRPRPLPTRRIER